jgi:hypothetical protein
MGDTYSQAQRVLIWIGSRRGSPRGGYSQLTELGLNRKSLKFLINQLWFSRRWVIQEVARSYTAIVVWGDEMMDFEKFVQYASQCATTTVLTTMEREALVRLASIVLCRDTASAVNNQRPLLQLLVDFHAAQCSDDRDRLYALKGLSSCSIVVDYEQSADAVYRGFAAAELFSIRVSYWHAQVLFDRTQGRLTQVEKAHWLGTQTRPRGSQTGGCLRLTYLLACPRI